MQEALFEFPRSLLSYPDASGLPLLDALRGRIDVDPFNAVATAIFAFSILHTFVASHFIAASKRVQARADERRLGRGRSPHPSVLAEALHFLGEVEVVFGLWSLPLLAGIVAMYGWATAVHYVNDSVDYTEPMFVVVIMALCGSRPIVMLAESVLRQVARLGRSTPAAWWLSILVLGPLLGSVITEPAAMTISALLLARQFFDLRPSIALSYATLGLLFVNVSIGGTLTPFAAPPVLMVARPWGWETGFMLEHFGGRAAMAIVVSSAVYYTIFRSEFRALGSRQPVLDIERPAEEATALLPPPVWITLIHVGFIAWTVANAHHPALFLGGFLFWLGFTKATAAFQQELDIKTPLLVGFFLAGLKIHGGLQGWWIAPTLSSLSETGLFWCATLLTAFNDNALITYLATLVPGFSESLKLAVVAGAVTGGGLTVIANAPNPAGQSLLSRFFNGSVSPLRLFAAAAIPTLLAAIAFRAFQ